MTSDALPPGPGAAELRDVVAPVDWLDALQNDPDVLAKLRALPDGQGTLIALIRESTWHPNLHLPIMALALLGPPNERSDACFFEVLEAEANRADEAALDALLARSFGDEDLTARIVTTLSAQRSGRLEYLLDRCLQPNIRGFPKGLTEDPAFDRWSFALRSAPIALLPRADFQEMLLDCVRRDPDGPVERRFAGIVDRFIKYPPRPQTLRTWRVEQIPDAVTRERQYRNTLRQELRANLAGSRDPLKHADALSALLMNEYVWAAKPLPDTPPTLVTQRKEEAVDPPPEMMAAWRRLPEIAADLRERIDQLHPKWERIEDYIHEMDTVEERCQPGHEERYGMWDCEIEWREACVAERMVRFPDRKAVRAALETLLFNRPAIWLQGYDANNDYIPNGWRWVAWRTLIKELLTFDEALACVRLMVERGPWDREARKSKESLVALARILAGREGIEDFFAEMSRREDVGQIAQSCVKYYLTDSSYLRSLR